MFDIYATNAEIKLKALSENKWCNNLRAKYGDIIKWKLRKNLSRKKKESSKQISQVS